MPALPLKNEYRPTLGELLGPRWRGASLGGRALWLGLAAAATAMIVGATLTLLAPTISYGGPVPFSFSYGGLYRAAPEAGEYVRVQRLIDGRLHDSFAVGPLALPPYRGAIGAALALYAVGYVQQLAHTRLPSEGAVVVRGEGSTQIDAVSGYATYNVFYTTTLSGRAMYGRDVLLLPDHADARQGVAIEMLTAVAGNRQVTSALDVGVKGALEEPLGSFALE
ncbi:MAG TPA: hypothetical protein VNV37_03005 [Solirubrobacteraceae bacterium]|jgi:hypothetical protein|nr:hypothetical protein [Solirubrobacteraceae bacterium]